MATQPLRGRMSNSVVPSGIVSGAERGGILSMAVAVKLIGGNFLSDIINVREYLRYFPSGDTRACCRLLYRPFVYSWQSGSVHWLTTRWSRPVASTSIGTSTFRVCDVRT